MMKNLLMLLALVLLSLIIFNSCELKSPYYNATIIYINGNIQTLKCTEITHEKNNLVKFKYKNKYNFINTDLIKTISVEIKYE